MILDRSEANTESLTFWAAMIAIGWVVSFAISWGIHLALRDLSDANSVVTIPIGVVVCAGGSALIFKIGVWIVRQFPHLRKGSISHHLIPLVVGAFFSWVRPDPDEGIVRVGGIHMLQVGVEIYLLGYFVSYLLLAIKLQIPLLWIHKVAPLMSLATVVWLIYHAPY